MSTLSISIDKKLKSFSGPDTSSDSPGFIQPGTYGVNELKENYPNADTDYAQVSSDLGDVWICIRWKDNSYGTFASGPETAPLPTGSASSALTDALSDIASAAGRVNFNAASDAVDEKDLVSIVKDYEGFGYHLTKPAYPYDLKGINLPLTPPNDKQNNCCTFAEGLLVKAWSDSFSDFEWNNKRHGQMMIYSKEDYFSPITAALEAGMGEEVTDVEAAPQPWTLVQGWKTQWTGGHTFIIVDHHAETDKILTLESNKAFKLNGVGFRKIGMAEDFDFAPPENWWEIPGVWTWEQIKNSYKFRAMATLKVKNRSWSGI